MTQGHAFGTTPPQPMRDFVLTLGIMVLGLAVLVPVFLLQSDLQECRNRHIAGEIVAFFEASKSKGVDFMQIPTVSHTVERMVAGSMSPPREPATRAQLIRLQGYTTAELNAAVPYLVVMAGTLRVAAEASPAAPTIAAVRMD